MEIIGLRSKNITFNAKVGQRQYRLSEQQSIGIPDNNFVIGFSIRFNYEDGNDVAKSINGRKLIDYNSLKGSTLNLRGWGTETFLADANLWNFVNVPDFVNPLDFNEFGQPYMSFIKPTKAKEISWTKSSIAVSNEVANNFITSDMDFEFIVYHCTNDYKSFDGLMPQTTQIYLGKCIKAHFHNTIQVNIPSSSSAPNFATTPFTFDGKSGIDRNSIIFGVRAWQVNYQTYDGKTQPSTRTFGASFLDLKRTDTYLLDKIPILNVTAQQALSIPYLMIEPTPAYLIDWQGSNIFTSDNTNTLPDSAFLLQFFYFFQDDIVKNLDV
jgi:hypothetical protein